MTFSGYDIPLPEGLAERLSELPMVRQRQLVESAVNRALDSAGFPRVQNGDIVLPRWYVILTRHGALHGHVGPMSDEASARRAASSWRRAKGYRATVTRKPVGIPLTNAHES